MARLGPRRRGQPAIHRKGARSGHQLLRHRRPVLEWRQRRGPRASAARLGAVQAQDYSGARWAVGLRAEGLTDASVEKAFDEGAILRTHVMRPTWHFVAPADIRRLLALTAPRVLAVSGSSHRKLGLDPRTFQRSEKALERALRGGRHLTRPELGTILRRAGIAADGQRRSSSFPLKELLFAGRFDNPARADLLHVDYTRFGRRFSTASNDLVAHNLYAY